MYLFSTVSTVQRRLIAQDVSSRRREALICKPRLESPVIAFQILSQAFSYRSTNLQRGLSLLPQLQVLTYSSATGPSSESAHGAKQLTYMRVIRARQAANQSKYPSKSYLKRHRRQKYIFRALASCTQGIWGKVLCKYSTQTVRNLSTTCKCRVTIQQLGKLLLLLLSPTL